MIYFRLFIEIIGWIVFVSILGFVLFAILQDAASIIIGKYRDFVFVWRIGFYPGKYMPTSLQLKNGSRWNHWFQGFYWKESEAERDL